MRKFRSELLAVQLWGHVLRLARKPVSQLYYGENSFYTTYITLILLLIQCINGCFDNLNVEIVKLIKTPKAPVLLSFMQFMMHFYFYSLRDAFQFSSLLWPHQATRLLSIYSCYVTVYVQKIKEKQTAATVKTVCTTNTHVGSCRQLKRNWQICSQFYIPQFHITKAESEVGSAFSVGR